MDPTKEEKKGRAKWARRTMKEKQNGDRRNEYSRLRSAKRLE
jgi:hypothetical protein